MCNRGLMRLPRFQQVLNMAAGLIYARGRFDHITSQLKDRFYWLLVPKWIHFKCCMFVYKALHVLYHRTLLIIVWTSIPTKVIRVLDHLNHLKISSQDLKTVQYNQALRTVCWWTIQVYRIYYWTAWKMLAWVTSSNQYSKHIYFN